MLFAVALDTFFTAAVAVVALAILVEWMYLREQRKRNQRNETIFQSPNKPHPC